MCVITAAMMGGSAVAAMGANIALAGLGIAAVSTVTSTMQANTQAQIAQQQANAEAERNRQQLDLQYQQAQKQAYANNQQIVARHIADVRAQQASRQAFEQQRVYNQQASDRVYQAEQAKFVSAKKAAAFKMQEIYAKQIGSMGSVLATGRTGQSVGLLAMDASRQAGFAEAEQKASVGSAYDKVAIGMQLASDKQLSSDNVAYSNLLQPIQAPIFEPEPVGEGTDLELGIPAYNWT